MSSKPKPCLNMSLEAQFHRQIKSLKWCSKRMQGEVMGAFRAVVPIDVFAVHGKMVEASARADASDLAVESAQAVFDAIKKDNNALKEQINSQCDQIEKLTMQLHRARQGAKQSRSRSLAETCTSTSLGFVGSLCITWGTVAAIANVGTASLVATLGCTVWSFVRGYSIRRYFNSKG